MAADRDAWEKAHDAYLEVHLHRLRLRVEQRLGEEQDDAIGRSIAAHESRLRELEEELATLGAPSGVQTLREVARLSEVELEAVLLALAPELDPTFHALYANLHGDPSQRSPTAALLATVSQRSLAETWDLFHPDAPAQRFRLLDLPHGGSMTAATPLRIDQRVVNFLRGINHLDRRLEGAVDVIPPLPLAGGHVILAASIASWLADVERSSGRGVVNLVGPPGQGREAVAAATARALGFVPLRLGPARLSAVRDVDELVRLLDRESLLLPAAVYVDVPEAGTEEPAVVAGTREVMDQLAGLLFVGSGQRVEGRRRTISVRVPVPAPGDRAELWAQALAQAGCTGWDTEVAAIVEQFELGSEAVLRTVDEAVGLAELEGGQTVMQPRHLWAACRGWVGRELGELARRLDGAHRWEQLILPDREHQLLRQVAAQVGQRPRVYEEWGFGPRLSRGRGITALFAGPPGTGKTMAAEIIAGHLALDLYRIDLSSVVSKYIGETEKNLRRLFDAASQGGAILLFDEADALFAKRSEVKDSHDRYANIEVNYLLQRMEEYAGLAILATNRKADLDPAFLRRIRFVVSFPFPDAPHRRRIWEAVFPPEAPLCEVDFETLARLEIAGGNIRNIAVNAAFLAADAGQPIGMAHVLAAARHEYEKLERRPSRNEFGPYYEAVTG